MENNWTGNYPNPNANDLDATMSPHEFQNRAKNMSEQQGYAQPASPQYAPAQTPYGEEQTVYAGAYGRDQGVTPPAQNPWQNAPQEYNPYAAQMAQGYGAYGNQPYPVDYAQNNGYYAPQPNAAPGNGAYGNQPYPVDYAQNNGYYAPQQNATPDNGAYGNQPYPVDYAQNNGYYAQQQNAAPDNGAYGNQPYPVDYAQNNGYYAQPAAQNYGAYPTQPQQKKKSNTVLYVLITSMIICFVAVAALCIYFLTDSDEKDSTTKDTSRDYHTRETTEPEDPTEEPTESEQTQPIETQTVPTTEAPTTEPPTTEPPTTEPPTTEDPYLYLDELNRRYDNYFDFQPDENGHVIAHSSSRLISRQELYGMTEHEVCIARNELYARHGYIFQTEKYNEYFKNFDWYHPTTTTLPTLSEIESENAKLISAFEDEHGW